jgi:hypothetical protein
MANPFLPEQDRAGGNQTDQEGDQQAQNQMQREGQQNEAQVQTTFPTRYYDVGLVVCLHERLKTIILVCNGFDFGSDGSPRAAAATKYL